jgi:hypothetical protein
MKVIQVSLAADPAVRHRATGSELRLRFSQSNVALFACALLYPDASKAIVERTTASDIFQK